ncbi:recombinase family protein [Mesorhizobium sp. M0317]|uniref:recombinase family protein n=1 Tax=Mesorhizobium sp. M0317 TaxID=2956935 RepID=UPI00333D1625
MIANPIYGGAYAYGKSRSVPGYGGRSGIRRKARDEWLALIPDAHEGYVSWERAEEIRKMVSDNVPASRHHGAPKHGDALRPFPLQKVRPEADGSLHRSQP